MVGGGKGLQEPPPPSRPSFFAAYSWPGQTAVGPAGLSVLVFPFPSPAPCSPPVPSVPLPATDMKEERQG